MNFLRAAALTLLLSFAFVSQSAHAGCGETMATILKHIDQDMLPQARQELVSHLRAAGVPAFTKEAGNGESIPVILVNADTEPKIAEFMDHSFGTQIVLQPNWNNDHGMLRAGAKIIDVDTPGARGYGEIHDTGIAWKGLRSYLERKGPDDYVILEVAYALRPDELAAAEYYQRSRRAAIFRVPFTFGGAENDLTRPNTLLGGGEHCFLFCKATEVSSHLSEISAKMSAAGVDDADEFLRKPEVVEFLNYAQRTILEADPDGLEPMMVNQNDGLELLQGALPAGLSREKQEELANWVVAYDASKRYQALMQRLQVSGNLGVEDMSNPRATAILIYDDVGQSEAFRNATYSTAGKMETWNTNGQSPLPKP